jgi:hypothetical protein
MYGRGRFAVPFAVFHRDNSVPLSALDGGGEGFRQLIIKVQIKRIAVVAKRCDSANESIRHSLAHSIAGEVNQLIQHLLDFCPPQLVFLWNGHNNWIFS